MASVMEIIISAQDQASAVLKSIAGTAAEGSEGVTKLSGAFASGQSALTSFSGEMEGVVSKFGEMGKVVAEAIGEGGGLGIAGLAGVAAVGAAALTELGTSGGATLNEMNLLASTLGTGISEASKLSLTFEDATGSSNSLTRMAGQLNQVLGQASDELAKGNDVTGKAAIIQKELNINVGEGATSYSVLNALLPKLSAMYQDAGTRQQALSLSTQLFGLRGKELNVVLQDYGHLSEVAAGQEERMGSAWDDGGKKAEDYNIAVTNLKVTYDKFAVESVPLLTFALKEANQMMEGLDPSRLFHGDLIPADWEHALERLGISGHHAADGVGAVAGAAAASVAPIAGAAAAARDASDAFDKLVQKDIASTVTKDQANRAQAEANRLMGIATDLEGKALPSTEDLTKSYLDSARATQAKSQAETEGITQLRALIASGTDANAVADSAIVKQYDDAAAAKADAAAKKDSAVASKALADTLQGHIDKLYEESKASDLSQQAMVIWAQQTGRQTDLMNNLLPSMNDLVKEKLDSYNATLRDNEAQKEANSILGIQTDITGKVVKSFQDLVKEKKSSILASQEDQKAMDEANKELGIVSATIDSTASSVSSLTSSLTAATAGWHQMTDAESQSAGKANASNSANTKPNATNSAGVATPAYSGGSVAFFSYGSHAGGLPYVPYDNYPALLHKGEAVVPAGQNTGNSAPITIVLQMGSGMKDLVFKVVRDGLNGGAFRGVLT